MDRPNISLRFDNGVQEGDRPILLVVFHCKLYGRVNTIDVLKEVLFVNFLVDDKGVIHKPVPKTRGCGTVNLKLFVLGTPYTSLLLWADWGTHGCTLNMFMEVVLEGEVCVFKTKLQ